MATINGWKDCWKKPVKVQYKEIIKTEEIRTREGKFYGYVGQDVLLKGVKGEVYPCKKEIFAQTYSLEEPRSEEQIRLDERNKIRELITNLTFGHENLNLKETILRKIDEMTP